MAPELLRFHRPDRPYLWLRLVMVLASGTAILLSPLFVPAMTFPSSVLLLAVVTPAFALYLFAYKSLMGSVVSGVLMTAVLVAGLASIPAPSPDTSFVIVSSRWRFAWPLSTWVIAGAGLWLDLWARLGSNDQLTDETSGEID